MSPRRKTVRVTPRQIKGWGGCRAEDFRRKYPRGVSLRVLLPRLTQDEALWLLDHYPETDTAQRAYREAVAPAQRAYREATTPAWQAYQEGTDTAQRAYDEAEAPAWRAYLEATAPAWQAYLRDALAAIERRATGGRP